MMRASYVSGAGSSECPLKSSNGAGALVLQGFQGWWGFAASKPIPLISPWPRELFHLECIFKKLCRSMLYDFLAEEFFHLFR